MIVSHTMIMIFKLILKQSLHILGQKLLEDNLLSMEE